MHADSSPVHMPPLVRRLLLLMPERDGVDHSLQHVWDSWPLARLRKRKSGRTSSGSGGGRVGQIATPISMPPLLCASHHSPGTPLRRAGRLRDRPTLERAPGCRPAARAMSAALLESCGPITGPSSPPSRPDQKLQACREAVARFKAYQWLRCIRCILKTKKMPTESASDRDAMQLPPRRRLTLAGRRARGQVYS